MSILLISLSPTQATSIEFGIHISYFHLHFALRSVFVVFRLPFADFPLGHFLSAIAVIMLFFEKVFTVFFERHLY